MDDNQNIMFGMLNEIDNDIADAKKKLKDIKNNLDDISKTIEKEIESIEKTLASIPDYTSKENKNSED